MNKRSKVLLITYKITWQKPQYLWEVQYSKVFFKFMYHKNVSQFHFLDFPGIFAAVSELDTLLRRPMIKTGERMYVFLHPSTTLKQHSPQHNPQHRIACPTRHLSGTEGGYDQTLPQKWMGTASVFATITLKTIEGEW